MNGPSNADSRRFLQFALTLADTARAILEDTPARGGEVTLKPDGSYVSQADTRIEAAWREALGRAFPDHGVIGEEYAAESPSSPWQWVLDPIDGTDNFVHGLETFGTLVALRHEGRPVLGVIDHPRLDMRVQAARGQGAYANGEALRITGPGPGGGVPMLAATAPENFANGGHMAVFCALARHFPNLRVYRDCFAHTAVARGAAVAMVDWHVRVWDVAAAEAVVTEAGGRYVRLPGPADRYQVVFGWPQAVADALAVIESAM